MRDENFVLVNRDLGVVVEGFERIVFDDVQFPVGGDAHQFLEFGHEVSAGANPQPTTINFDFDFAMPVLVFRFLQFRFGPARVSFGIADFHPRLSQIAARPLYFRFSPIQVPRRRGVLAGFDRFRRRHVSLLFLLVEFPTAGSFNPITGYLRRR
jgi:hypothetical protein